MTVSTWVRGKDWISAGLWGMEKNEDFIKSFAKWRKFVADYYPRVQLLTMPDAHHVEQARMAAQLAKLPAKYKKGALFLETNITASKDLFIFGSKPPGKDDNDEAPGSRVTGRLSLYGVKLCQRVRAKSALRKVRNGQIRQDKAKRALIKVRNGQIRKNLKPASKEEDIAPAKRRRIALEIRPPSQAPAALEGVSEGAKDDGHQDHEPEMADGGSTAAMEEDGNTSGDVVVPDAAPSSNGSVSLNTGVSGGTASRSRRSPPLRGGIAGRAQTRPKETVTKSDDEHQSFIKAREWLASSAVRDSRKSAKKDAKKNAASLRVAASSGAGCSSHSSDAADKSPCDKSCSDSDSDESNSDSVWTPSTVTVVNRAYVILTRKSDETTCRVNRGRKSGCILHHIYDDVSGESQLVQIQSVKYESDTKEWKMEFCHVYGGRKALTLAEQEKDKTVMVGGKNLVQRGREWLRETVSTGKLQYHVGDVRRKWRLDYVLGICAWLPASALLCDKKALAARKNELCKALLSDGVSVREAKLLADDPIYLGENFSEASPEQCSDSDGGDSSESDSDSDKKSESDSDSDKKSPAGAVKQPSRGPLRKLRAERGKIELFDVCAGAEDSENVPFFHDRPGVGGRRGDGHGGPSHGRGAEEEGTGGGGGRGRGRVGACSGAAAGGDETDSDDLDKPLATRLARSVKVGGAPVNADKSAGKGAAAGSTDRGRGQRRRSGAGRGMAELGCG